MKVLRTLAVIALLMVIAQCALNIYIRLPHANGLKVTYKSLTTVVRYPHAHCYTKGDMIPVRVNERMTVNAVVVEPVTLDSELIDDEVSADEQPTFLTAF